PFRVEVETTFLIPSIDGGDDVTDQELVVKSPSLKTDPKVVAQLFRFGSAGYDDIVRIKTIFSCVCISCERNDPRFVLLDSMHVPVPLEVHAWAFCETVIQDLFSPSLRDVNER